MYQQNNKEMYMKDVEWANLVFCVTYYCDNHIDSSFSTTVESLKA